MHLKDQKLTDKLPGSGWGGFGLPMGGGAPGLSNPPSRTSTLSNFSQAIGGGSSAQTPLDLSCVPSPIITPSLSGMASKQKKTRHKWRGLNLGVSTNGALDFANADFGDNYQGAGSKDEPKEEDASDVPDSDSKFDPIDMSKADASLLSEFPSLSGGGPQSQNPNNMSQAWNSTALRQAQPSQQTPVQRPGGPPGSQQREPSVQQSQQSSHQPENPFHFGSSMEGQYDGQRSSAARSENNSAQTGTADDFPPLGGGLNGDSRHDRQGGLLQGSGFGAGLGSNTFGQSRSGVPGQTNGQGERANDMSLSEGGFGAGAMDCRSALLSRCANY